MVICVINQKGGVGKTTTAVNLSVSLAQWGQETLLVDIDPQGNATSGVGSPAPISPTLYDCLVSTTLHSATNSNGNHQAQETSASTSSDGGAGEQEDDSESQIPLRPGVSEGPVEKLGVLGASADLAGSEVELADNPRRDDFKRVLAELSDKYPLIIVDTPPSLSLITVNALVAADSLIIPIQCEYFALEGLGQLLRTVERIKRSLNPDLQILGLLRTMYDARLGLSEQVSQELESHFSQLLFQTIIPRNVRLAEAPSHGIPIALYDRRSPGADAYRRLAVEVLTRTGLQPQNGPVSLTKKVSQLLRPAAGRKNS
jgi:chromosome partitioning protein